MHKSGCKSDRAKEWSGYPNPDNPDNEWLCDECEGVIPADPDLESLLENDSLGG